MRFAALLLLLPLACSNRHDERARTMSTLDGQLPRQMRNCPSAVPSARTTVQPTKFGVELTITSDDASARDKIVELAKLQADQKDPVWVVPQHSGMHGGPGTMGRCPIIHADTNVTYQEIPNGVRIDVTVSSHGRVIALQRATLARVRALTQPTS
jgi:hypothetical protein